LRSRELSQSSGQGSNSETPKPTKDDAAYIALKVAIGSIPYVGAALAEVFAATIPSPVSKRTAEWWEDVAKRVAALEKSGINMKNLASDPAFISLVERASKMATQSAQQEKLDALKNAIVNAAAGIDIKADERKIFLNLVDELTPSHLLMLEFLSDPGPYGKAHGVKYESHMLGGSPAALLEEAFPEWKGKREVYDLILQDINTKGLVRNGIHSLMSEPGMYQSRTTSRGKQFLDFIKAQP
jgi:hypothetical protein